MLSQNEYGVWQIDLTVNFERCRKSTRTKNKTLAEKLHALTEAEMLKGTWGINKKTYSLRDAFAAALKSHWKGNKSEYKVNQNWELLTGGTKPLLDSSKDVSSVTPEVIRDIIIKLSEQGNAPATINRKMATLRTLLNLCVEWGKLNHAPKIKALKEPPSRHRVLTTNEEVRMMRFFDKYYSKEQVASLIEFLLSSGNRLSEVLELTWQDVDFENGVVRFIDTKSGDTLHKPFTDVMKTVLESRKSLKTPFPYTVDMVENYWKHLRIHLEYQTDETFVPHSLRHTCASRLVASGMDLRRVQMWLGHKSYSTTLKYAQLSQGHLKDVVEMLNKPVKDFDYSLPLEAKRQSVGESVVNH